MTTKKFCNMCGHELSNAEERNELQMGTMFGVPTSDFSDDYLFDHNYSYGFTNDLQKKRNKEYLIKNGIKKKADRYKHNDICNECLKIARRDQQRTMKVLKVDTPRKTVINKIPISNEIDDLSDTWLFLFIIFIFLVGFSIGAVLL